MSNTIENRAALARARALLAYEFGDGFTDAKTDVDELAGQGGLDGDIAAAYLALAQNDGKAAKLAGDAAVSRAGNDAAALYVVGEAEQLAGDIKGAIGHLRVALEGDARPLYAVGLARALAAANAWDDALATLDRTLAAHAGNPAAVIARARILAQSGRVAPGSAPGGDARAQLERVLAEAAKPIADQPHGVSPGQVAFGHLALAKLDFALARVDAMRTDLNAALALRYDEPRFAEEVVDTMLATGQLELARKAAEGAVASFPTSKRARLALASIALAQGKPVDALDVLSKQADVIALPQAQAVRGQARFAIGDYDNARGDFEAALRKLPNLELAIVGRAWLDLALGDVDAARRAVEAAYSAKTASPALATVYAAVLRRSADKDGRDKAKAILDKVVAGAPGPDVARAELELARVYRDAGDYRQARGAYAEAARGGNLDARLESGLLQIDDRDPLGGRETLDGVLKSAGEHPSAALVVEVARARMLVGDHAGAAQLLDQAQQTSGVEKWKLDRERARLALRKNDPASAAQAIGRALDGSGDDAETFFIGADVVTADDKQTALADKLKKLAAARLRQSPVADVVSGKLLLAAGKFEDAERLFTRARDAFGAALATPRLQAQAYFGIMLAAYYRRDEASAINALDAVTISDPSMYAAYQAAAAMLGGKEPRKALEHLQRAVAYNPDLVDGWVDLGKLAAKVGDKKQLADAIAKLAAIAPNDPGLKELRALKR